MTTAFHQKSEQHGWLNYITSYKLHTMTNTQSRFETGLSNFLFHGATSPSGQDLLIEVSRSHSDTPHTEGLHWTSDRHDADSPNSIVNSTKTQTGHLYDTSWGWWLKNVSIVQYIRVLLYLTITVHHRGSK